MAKKATHYGTCQACGRLQLLPGGRLSDHGYELQHGFRNGVCMGAGHLPLEVSCDIVESSIAAASARCAQAREDADNIEALPYGDLTCWKRVYHRELSSRTRGAVYLWHKGVVEGEGFDAVFVYGTRPTERESTRSGYIKAASFAKGCREAYAEALRARADADGVYCARMIEMLRTWAPKELKARKGVAA